MFYFSPKYLLLTFVLLITEICIALFLHDRFIRPYFGDFLVVMLIYCFVRSFLNASVWRTAIAVLLFAWFIEMMQYFQLVQRLGLENNKFARTIIGSSFGWEDMAAYTFGIITVLLLERKKNTCQAFPGRNTWQVKLL
ncbi:DUF2809 domain-containing protein [Ferruginibacter sp. HRS2-29]|uniref:ribosomal maturation YjgA family protein n=1 Tax=Ferruginibacter sp. HRS2-29 TaxID=2487334 RepID=UPI0020CC7254|nr:DUF2809 domain-containing protein [Ferruginibacter sp. HRS2-29]MCP9750344.1 DUF2809 domain-containing protein [Ferruginibacter sp. HRS2-29]